jgi:hypothetical protein
MLSKKNEVLWKYIWLLVFFSLATLYFTWPVANHIQSSFIAEKQKSDATQYIWNNYIFDDNVTFDKPLFETDKVLTPQKVNLWMHTYTPLMSAFGLLFDNKILGVNLFMLIHFILAALGAYILVNKFLNHHLASVLVALLFAFSPFKMIHLPQHYHLMLCGFMPWFILSFLRLKDIYICNQVKSIAFFKEVAICLVLWVLTLLSDYYSAAFLIYFVGLYILYYVYMKYFNHIKKLYILGGVVLLFVVSHVMIKYLYGKVDDKGGIYWGGDLVNLFVPNANTFLFDRSFFELKFHNLTYLLSSHEHQIYMGMVTIFLLLTTIVIYIRKRETWQLNVWQFIAVVFILIVFPSISFVGHRLCYSPTALLHFIPFFNNIRCPTRILGILHLILPLGLLMYIIPKLAVKYNKISIDICFGLLIVFSLVDLKTKPLNTLGETDVPKAISYIKELKGKTLLTMPTGIVDGMDKVGDFNVNQLYYQTIHHKQLIGGYISRLPKETFEYYKQDSVMNYILKLSAEGPSEIPMFSTAALNTFHQKFHPDMIYLENLHAGKNELDFFKHVVFEGKQIKETKIGNEVVLEILE